MNDKPKILIIDDEECTRVLLKKILERQDYDPVLASSGEEALALIEDNEIDLILLDIMMPELDGFEVLDILKGTEETKDIKVIMLTAMSQVEDKARAFSGGASDYIVKPFERKELIARIESQIALKRGVKDLKQAKERYEDLFEGANDLIFTTDADGFVLTVNRRVEEITGYSRVEMIGENIIKFSSPDDHEKFYDFWKCIHSGKRPTYELKLLTKYSDTVFMLTTGRAIEADGKIMEIQYNAQDITERKKMESMVKEKNEEILVMGEELLELNLNLEQKVEDRTVEVEKLLKHKDRFISQLGHDLKSPLTPLVTLLSIVAKEEDNPDLKELIRVSIENANFMKELVVKTLSLAKLNSSNTEFNLIDLDLSEEISAVIRSKHQLFKDRNIEVENKIGEGVFVKADRLMLKELIDNLITNAIKFSQEADGILTIDAEMKDGFTTVSIEDTGIGMTEAELSHIFDEFYKADFSRHDLNSSGLGLSICKRIVEKHGGKIWCESPGRGKGSTFYFTMKLERRYNEVLCGAHSLKY
ncbi:MAG: response regulator [Halobacteriota archaeon]|nr:response regulator [Halobacteriota archaeon]